MSLTNSNDFPGLAFSSGSATTATITNMLSAGSHIISVNDVYGGTYRYFTKVASTNGVDVSFIDMYDPANVEKAWKPNTRMVWMETPSMLILFYSLINPPRSHSNSLLLNNII